jgi:hypothetical protein
MMPAGDQTEYATPTEFETLVRTGLYKYFAPTELRSPHFVGLMMVQKPGPKPGRGAARRSLKLWRASRQVGPAQFIACSWSANCKS